MDWHHRVLGAALLLAGTGAAGQAVAAPTWTAEARLRGEDTGANPRGPLADAARRDPAFTPDTAARGQAELEVSGQQRWGAHSLAARVSARAGAVRGGGRDTSAEVQDLALSSAWGAWQTSLGRKVVSWDVGHAFRPNDLVQQEERRGLLASTPRGRPLIQLEGFEAERSLALVWVQPQHLGEPEDRSLGPQESALAMRAWQRQGTADLHAFARLGEHTGLSLGAAMAAVQGEAWALHGSARWMPRHDGWQIPQDGAPPGGANPWQIGRRGPATQALLGASWTGAAQQSVLVEAWYDGTALSEADWRTWAAGRAAAAAAGAGPGEAGALAWQASPLAGLFGLPVLRRQNAFVRLAWQPEAWTLSLDAWITPTDGGQAWTSAVQWQGDRLRLQAAWRILRGPQDALLAQLPTRRSAAVQASWSW